MKKTRPKTLIGLLAVLLTHAWADSTNASHYQLPGGAASYSDPFIAAGFRALFTCSAHFIMHRELSQILKVELADTTDLGLPPPEIDNTRRLVRAADGLGRQAIAAYRDTMGCTLLPPDGSEGDIPALPYVSRRLPQQDPVRAFPFGDQADPRPTKTQLAWLESAFGGSNYGEHTLSAGVVIIKDGHIVAERYGEGFGIHQGYRTWSTAKSISASLIGIASHAGLLDLDAPTAIPEWQGPADPRAAITPRQLLWMSSGLWSQGANTNALYFAGQDVISAATTTQLEAEPGTRWKYANNDTLLLLRALRHALDNDLTYLRYPYDELLHKIGMYNTWMEIDHKGNFIGSSQVYTTARDIARLGLLYLNKGRWAGEQILPPGWSDFVAQPAPTLPPEPGKRGYGAQFWLFDQIDGIPAGTYTTAGNKGQYSTIVPAHNMVIVRTGVDPLGARWDQPQFVIDAIREFSHSR